MLQSPFVRLEVPVVETWDLIEFASDAAVVVDQDRTIIAWNAAAEGLLGHSADDVVGVPCYEVLRAVRPDGQAVCGKTCEGGSCFDRCEPYTVAACNVSHRDGHAVPVGISTMIVPKRRKTAEKGSDAAVIFLRSPDAASAVPKTAEPPVRIYLFGHFGLSVDGNGLAVEHWQRKQALTLLKYLTHHAGRAVHRERLIGLLWPDSGETQGRERLKVTLYFLRHQLRDAGLSDEIIETAGPAYILKRDKVWIDCESFENLYKEGERHLRAGHSDEAVRCFEEAQALYRVDYLEEDLYADWCAEELERLCEIYLDVLGRLADSYAERGSYASAAQICRSALVREPCRERFHRALMDYLFHLGRSDRAIAQYQRCEKLLAHELGVDPSTETRKLYEHILHATRTGRAQSH